MEMLQNLTRANTRANEAPPSNPPAPTAMEEGNPSKTLHIWKRFMIIIGISMTHGLTGSIVAYLETLRVRQEQEALAEYVRLSGTTPMLREENRNRNSRQNNQNQIWMKGERLDRSLANQGRPWSREEADCSHPQDILASRGGRNNSKWYTCLACGARWKRVLDLDAMAMRDRSQSTTTTLTPASSSQQRLNALELEPTPAQQSGMLLPVNEDFIDVVAIGHETAITHHRTTMANRRVANRPIQRTQSPTPSEASTAATLSGMEVVSNPQGPLLMVSTAPNSQSDPGRESQEHVTNNLINHGYTPARAMEVASMITQNEDTFRTIQNTYHMMSASGQLDHMGIIRQMTLQAETPQQLQLIQSFGEYQARVLQILD